MASLIYNEAVNATVRGQLDFDTDSFKVLLVTSAYAPNKDTHLTRNQITNEVVGAGYTAGGVATTATVSKDLPNDRVEIAFSNVSWAEATITARAAVIYKDTGDAASDTLVAYVDFTNDVSSTNATFAVTFSSALRFQN